LMTIFKDSHHFSRTLGSLDDNLLRQPSLQQNLKQSLMTILNDSL